jgi:hypothetical protein
VWASIFAALASPIFWIGHGAGFAPAFYMFAGLATSGGQYELGIGEIVVAAMCLVATFVVVFLIAERAQGGQIRALVASSDQPEPFRTADECVNYLLQIEGSMDGPFGAELRNKFRETLSCVLGAEVTAYVYHPATGYGNGPSYSRGSHDGTPLTYTLFGQLEVAPPERCVPRDTLVSVLTDFLTEGGRSRRIHWEVPG